MELHVIDENFTVCKLEDCSGVDPNTPWCFLSRTDEEISLVCPTGRVPANTLVREDGWRAFRVQGVLDFSLVGILAQISGILAEGKISLFAVSTYNTDYILIKEPDFGRALALLEQSDCRIH